MIRSFVVALPLFGYAAAQLGRRAKKGHAVAPGQVVEVELPEEAPQGAVADTELQVPVLFEGSVHALHVPLVAMNQLFGAIQIEASSDEHLDDDDELLLISLATLMVAMDTAIVTVAGALSSVPSFTL